jgi:hypothetical protein
MQPPCAAAPRRWFRRIKLQLLLPIPSPKKPARSADASAKLRVPIPAASSCLFACYKKERGIRASCCSGLHQFVLRGNRRWGTPWRTSSSPARASPASRRRSGYTGKHYLPTPLHKHNPPLLSSVLTDGLLVSSRACRVVWCRKGVRCLVLESSPALRASGFAFTTWTNAFRALDALGVGDKIREHHLLYER